MNDSRFIVRFADYPLVSGRPALAGVLRTRPADFFVEEQLGFAPDGDGPHRMLWIEKTGANTEWVARQLARLARCRPMDVGFSGMKDRHAVTRQWFSVPAPKEDIDWQAVDIDGVRVLEAHAHRRKLRRGAHRANRFVLTVRDVSGGDDLDARVAQVRAQGVPNYFGPQRFGREGDNVARAVDGARGGIYLSAARSFLFNAVLAGRVTRGDWNRLLPGEAVQLDGSGSFFIANDIDATLLRRLDEFDIHPGGPLWGKGDTPSLQDAAALENDIANGLPEIRELLEKSGMRQERRALRLGVRELTVERVNEQILVISFELSPGAFATSVLRELINVTDRGESDAGAD
ncbi:MAG TPA: tRNA pseudouridine(13) synthase TruD [Gammaproteobacteria bacterium]